MKISRLLQRCVPGLVLALFASVHAAAATIPDRPSVRIMLVHGTWRPGPFEQTIQTRLESRLGEIADRRFEISQQFLGIYGDQSNAARSRFARHIEALIEERQIAFVVCTLPAACDFVADIRTGEAFVLMLGAAPATEERTFGRETYTNITTAAEEAITRTLEQIEALRPRAETVHLLSGSGTSDRRYLDLARSIVNGRDGGPAVKFHVADEPDSLLRVAGALDPKKDVGFVLTTEAYGDPPKGFPGGNLARTAANASAPLFVFWDAAIGTGIVGGHVTSAIAYGDQVAELVVQALREQTLPAEVAGQAMSIYDARFADRWNLDLSRIDGPISIINQQPTLWESNPNLVISLVAAGLLLALIIVLLSGFLVFSRRARKDLLRSEKAARENEAKYRWVADNSMDHIWSYDLARDRFTYCSSAVTAMTGFSPDEFAALPMNKIMTDASYEVLLEHIGSEEENVVFEIEQYRKDGSTFPSEVSFRIQRDQSDDGAILTGVTRDISLRRQREKAEEETRQRQKMESLGTLAAGIAHDFNNVLGVMVGLIDLVAIEPGASPRVRELTTRLGSAVERARGLTGRILTFSRGSREQKHPVDLGVVVKESLAHVDAILPASVEIVSRGLESDYMVQGDGNQLGQAVVNLLTNSIEALDYQGSGRIEFEIARVRPIETTSLKVGKLQANVEYVVLTLSDNGPGIPEDRLDRVFEPFYSSKVLGSGIGLAIVHSVLLDHGGAINLASSSSFGTTFSLYFPALLTETKRSKAASGDAGERVRRTRKTLRVLLIDDQLDLLHVAEQMLRAIGHECITCGDPQRAFGMIDREASKLDVVITDYSMPDVSGYEILDYCRNNCPNVVTYLATGFSDTETEADAMAHGAHGVLQKPVKLSTLSAVLQEIAEA